jgi:DNA polymerase-3 subunit epsilon
MSDTKPLCFLDLETTGTDAAKDRIASIAAVINEGGSASDVWLEELINPGIPIPAEATAVHGITNEMVAGKRTFKQAASTIHAFIRGCDLAGYNLLNYDLPLLWEEFHRVGITLDLSVVNVVDPCVVFREKEKRDLTAALLFYCAERHDGAHGARADVEATRKVLKAQLGRYHDLPQSIPELSAFCRQDRRVDLAGTIVLNDKSEPCYTAKRVRGVRVKDDPGFGTWMLRNDFPEETKIHLRRILGVR